MSVTVTKHYNEPKRLNRGLYPETFNCVTILTFIAHKTPLLSLRIAAVEWIFLMCFALAAKSPVCDYTCAEITSVEEEEKRKWLHTGIQGRLSSKQPDELLNHNFVSVWHLFTVSSNTFKYVCLSGMLDSTIYAIEVNGRLVLTLL